ncbi:hypothetical protein HY469_04505 [Candidatus Roizmanbacteria bacterium]|nr:hypothetical protein [Candidatus Roizmanbacteria bacterium]
MSRYPDNEAYYVDHGSRYHGDPLVTGGLWVDDEGWVHADTSFTYTTPEPWHGDPLKTGGLWVDSDGYVHKDD